MHLQSLELFGFKSFPDKTVFNFHEGITAIVGPNGCGKSNLLDAVRWVLGEQSAKSLRGGEMADVIFTGTDTRKPLSFAEVSLTLTDCATELGVDWHDVRVTRRVYRDGNSEYLLNKTLCRLRDIQNLFADTGVARSAYSMMEQGKIDLILSSRPEDRRTVFEEAAGITKYKGQKREALRKLEATEANLLRVGDIIKEVKRQIGSLQRQAGKARRYQALLADLQVLDTHHSRKQLESLERQLAECCAEIECITEKERTTRGHIDDGESRLAEQREALDAIDDQISDAREELQRRQSEIGTHRSRIEFNRQRAQEWAELIERARKDIAAAEPKRKQQASEIEQANSSIEEISQVLAEKRSELAELTQLASQLRATKAERETELREIELALSKDESRIATIEDELSGTTIRREATSERIRDLEAIIAEATTTRQNIQHKVDLARAATETEQKNLEQLFAETQSAEQTLQQGRQMLAGAEKSFTAIERALAEKESRLEVLKQLNEEGEGLAQGSQALLKGALDSSRIQQALSGPLIGKLEVEPKFAVAVEVALGRNIHGIVLHKSKLAAEIIAALGEKKLGQAALVIPELKGAWEPLENKALPQDALAWASEKVKAPDELEPIIQQLLRDVAIFSDFEHALTAKKADPALSAATIAGEFISAEGVVFGGSVQTESMLERKARVSILAAEYSVLNAQRDVLRQKRDEAKKQVEATEDELARSRERQQLAQVSQSTSGNEIVLLERELHSAEQKLAEFDSEKITLSQQIIAADERVAKLQEEFTATRRDFAARQDRQTTARHEQKEILARDEQTTARINDLRLALATEQQRHDNLATQREPMIARAAELEELIGARSADVATFESRVTAQAKESIDAEAAIKEQTARSAEIEKNLATLAAKRAKQVAAMNDDEMQLRSVRNALNELHDQRAAEQVRESQLQMKIDNLAEHIARRYHVDLRTFAPDETVFEKTLRVQLKRREGGSSAPNSQSGSDLDAINGGEAAQISTSPAERPIHPALDLGELEQIIAELTRRLDDMGPVNLDAVQEYDELEERHHFLETQNNDLTASRRELLDVIARINSTTQKLFAETFAQVRVNFREMFAELFGGGRADLSLMDESDLLNCGIEITAKPPGKQLQSISLLSGGERTMTAVALLFAIYMVRPSPFCVLDELDAPLDESNINRFIRVLERFVAQSQFIIITHNKRTIAKADILYGVTMEERGVSKLVGMKITERPQSAERLPDAIAGTETQRQFAMAENGDAEQKASFAATR